MCDKCQACMEKVQELGRQAVLGVTRTPEEIRNLEAVISGRRDPWSEPYQSKATPGEGAADKDLLHGGSIDEERVRQAMFGYSRNRRGEKMPLSVPLDNPRFSESFRREAAAIFAQATASCSSCCKLDSCQFTNR
jgi:hypothetical protein